MIKILIKSCVIRANFKRPAVSFESLFGICREFSAAAFQTATSNYFRQLREDSYQIIPPMTFEINISERIS